MAEIVTDQDENVDQLAEYEQLFRTVFELSDEGILVVEPDADGRVIEANPAAALMHGYTIEEMKKLRASDFHPAEVTANMDALIERAIAGEWVTNDHEHVKKDGSRFVAHSRVGSVYYNGRRVILAFNRDITNEKQIEEDLQQCEMKTAGKI